MPRLSTRTEQRGQATRNECPRTTAWKERLGETTTKGRPGQEAGVPAPPAPRPTAATGPTVPPAMTSASGARRASPRGGTRTPGAERPRAWVRLCLPREWRRLKLVGSRSRLRASWGAPGGPPRLAARRTTEARPEREAVVPEGPVRTMMATPARPRERDHSKARAREPMAAKEAPAAMAPPQASSREKTRRPGRMGVARRAAAQPSLLQ